MISIVEDAIAVCSLEARKAGKAETIQEGAEKADETIKGRAWEALDCSPGSAPSDQTDQGISLDRVLGPSASAANGVDHCRHCEERRDEAICPRRSRAISGIVSLRSQ